MSQKIVVISGRKQSGKSSAFNYLAGYLLRQADLIQKFELDEEGNLLVNADVPDPQTGEMHNEMGVLDLTRMDDEYVRYASRKIWPHIRPYHFADTLKEILVVVFQAKREELYGNDEDKNRPSTVKWGSIYSLFKISKAKQLNNPDDYLSNRQLLEVFGTDVCRALYSMCWTESCFKRIVNDAFPLAVICDGRFPEEIDYGKELGAISIRLTRNPQDGQHAAETSLDSYDKFDFVIDNTNMTQEEKGAELVKILQNLGWIH